MVSIKHSNFILAFEKPLLRRNLYIMCIDSTGVISVAVEGSDKDHLVVIGEGVDSANLTCSLRKKVSSGVDILSVEEVKEKEKPKEDKNPNNPEEHALVFHQYPPVPMFCEVVYDPDPSFCSIMWSMSWEFCSVCFLFRQSCMLRNLMLQCKGYR